MEEVERLRPYVDRAVTNFGIVLFKFGLVPDNHKLLTVYPDFRKYPNAVASIEERALYMSPILAAMPRNLALAAIAHELAHLILAHGGSHHKGEYEADQTALEILQFWGIPLNSLVALFKMLGESDIAEHSPTHPSGVSRVEYLEQCVRDMG